MRPGAIVWFFLTLVALSKGFPVKQNDNDGTSSFLPFIQFTKGGIKVNFGGYHAHANLGGRLTGTKQDGGLHVGAGTPSGAYASAGLGGSLENGPEGGLYASASLGNGSLNAQTGLSGSLGGSKREIPQYGNSLTNGRLAKGNILDEVEKIKHNKNIQESSSVSSSPFSSGISQRDNSKDEDTSADKSKYPAHLYFQKRLRERANGYLAKNNSNDSDGFVSPNIDTDFFITPENKSNSIKNSINEYAPIVLAREPAANEELITVEQNQKRRSTLFDDIFNIPISALNAVNQLLKNHVGKK